MLIEKEYKVLLNQVVTLPSDLIGDADGARAATLQPGYVLSAYPALGLFKEARDQIVYYVGNPRKAENDLVNDLAAAEHFTETRGIGEEEYDKGLTDAAIALMVKAKTYRALYMTNVQKNGVWENDDAPLALAKNIAAAVSFARNALPVKTYDRLDRALTASLTRFHMN